MAFLSGFKFDRTLHLLRKEMQRQLRKALFRKAFTPREQKTLARALSVESRGGQLQVVARDPKYFYLTSKRSRTSMRWLLGKTIALRTPSGLKFRRATARSIARGGWVYPAKPARDYVQTAALQAKKIIAKEIKADLRDMLMSELKKGFH